MSHTSLRTWSSDESPLMWAVHPIAATDGVFYNLTAHRSKKRAGIKRIIYKLGLNCIREVQVNNSALIKTKLFKKYKQNIGETKRYSREDTTEI